MLAGRIVISVIAALAVTAPALATNPQRFLTLEELRDYRAVARFMTAVDQYVVTHRVVEPVRPDFMCLPEGTVAALNELATLPIDARPRPREGDIFATEVADVFRSRIAGAIRGSGINVWDLVSDMNEDEVIAPPAQVGLAWPWGIGDGSTGWLTAALPLLPEALEYRLAGRDLVLYDVRDQVVVDVLRVAVPVY